MRVGCIRNRDDTRVYVKVDCRLRYPYQIGHSWVAVERQALSRWRKSLVNTLTSGRWVSAVYEVRVVFTLSLRIIELIEISIVSLDQSLVFSST